MSGKYRECPACGKRFLVPACNLYKLTVEGKVAHCCSYGCYREMQKKNAKEKDTLDYLGVERKL